MAEGPGVVSAAQTSSDNNAPTARPKLWTGMLPIRSRFIRVSLLPALARTAANRFRLHGYTSHPALSRLRELAGRARSADPSGRRCQAPVAIIVERLLDFFARIHHERAVLHDRFA